MLFVTGNDYATDYMYVHSMKIIKVIKDVFDVAGHTSCRPTWPSIEPSTSHVTIIM